MKPDVQKILTKLGKKQVELATHKVNLSSNINQILKQLEVFDSVLIQEERKVSDAFEKWDIAYQMWIDTLNDTTGDIEDVENKLKIFIKKVSDLGLNSQEIKGVDKAKRLIKEQKNYIKQEKGINWSMN